MSIAGPPKKLRRLSASQAQSCEQAKHPTCRCRCGGAAHGTKRGNVCDFPIDDPHFPGRPCPTCLATGKCSRCNGTGKLRELQFNWGNDESTERPCRQCNETGRCYKCGGSGGILRKGAREAAEREMQP